MRIQYEPNANRMRARCKSMSIRESGRWTTSSGGSEGGAEIASIIRDATPPPGLSPLGASRGGATGEGMLAKGLAMRHAAAMPPAGAQSFVSAPREEALWDSLAAAGVRITSPHSAGGSSTVESVSSD